MLVLMVKAKQNPRIHYGIPLVHVSQSGTSSIRLTVDA